MPGLRVLSGREVCDILKANGFTFVSQKGSHIKMRYEIEDETGIVIVTYSVTVPDHKTLKIGTLSGIIRQSGLPRELFEK